ncbi:helix-turn-helix transcriptional regulator [Bosea sp. OAE506]|uniref:helix-turn-helix transcriptional regulator n=1 Tax=Bosea sp. OAE506 TaxID=2663870 RepID=UPI00178AE067
MTNPSHLVSELIQENFDLKMQRDYALGALDAVAVAMALVERSGRFVYINRTGCRLLSAPGLLHLSKGRITASQPHTQKTFRRFLEGACGAARHGTVHRRSLLLRSEIKTLAALSVSIVPCPPSPAAHHPNELYLLAIKPLGTMEDITVTSRELFNLTSSEAQIASSLAAGLSLSEAAELHSIRVSTARTHLSRIFQKTDTQQQSQLVSLLRDAVLPVQR